MTKGILLIALGHTDYLKMAETLAVSIKHVTPDVSIALAHNYTEDQLKTVKTSYFDTLVEAPKESYTTGEKTEYIKVKTWMYDLSPWDKTIFLDVDMVWLFKKPITELFDKLSGLDWTISNTGIAGGSVWCDFDEVKAKYKDAQMWNYHSEFVYFEKGENAKRYFDKAKAMYLKPGLTKLTKFGGASMADEMAFQLASLELNEYPHAKDFTPTFWFGRDRSQMHVQPYKLAEEYYSYSYGGNHLPITVKQNYFLIANYHSKLSGGPRPYGIRDKRTFLKERKNI